MSYIASTSSAWTWLPRSLSNACRSRRAPPRRRSTAETVRAFEELSRASAAASSVRGSQVSPGAAKPQGSVTSSLQTGSLRDQPCSANAAASLHSDFVRGRPGATSLDSAAQQSERDHGPEGVHTGTCEMASTLEHPAL